jgi:hypothetical protein
VPRDRRPIVRAQAPEEARPAPAPVAIPSPGQLGVAPAPATDPTADWKAIRRRLLDLGADSFQLERLSQGGFRFTCCLPGRAGGTAQRFAGQGATEAEAVRDALAGAERWRGSQR